MQRMKKFTHQNNGFLILMLAEEWVFLPRVYQTLTEKSQLALWPLRRWLSGKQYYATIEKNQYQRSILITIILHSTKAKYTFSGKPTAQKGRFNMKKPKPNPREKQIIQ